MPSVLRRLRSRTPDEGGFTLLELTIALALSAFVFTALASLLGAGLRTLSVQKARTQGNEVATQGIEDLQQLAYDRLGLCGAPAGTVPVGMADTVLLGNCSGATVRYQPCPNPGFPSVGDVPAEAYTCPRLNIDYQVRRYVAWGDLARTEKRLAVFVTWTDSVGTHEVSQQSSLRIPNRADIVGLAPPRVEWTRVSPTSSTVDGSGVLANALQLEATISKPSPTGTDTVVASFNTLEGGAPTTRSVTLTDQPGMCTMPPPAGGRCFKGEIAAGTFTFGTGSQHFTFTVIRNVDAKVNSLVATPANEFCAGSCPATLPTITGSLAGAATTVDIDAAGALTADVVVQATTQNMTPTDSVSVVFETLSGAKTVTLVADDPTFPCVAGSCTGTWQVTIPRSAGYLFPAGTNRSLYFAAAQTVGPDPIDVGSTTASALSGLTFQ